jgi:uncharacterized integral membrane protein (TIGR00697 family)
MEFSLFSTSNELIFLFHSLFICFFTLCAAWLSQEALSIIIVMHCVLANLFVTKQITLFSLSATGTDAFIIGSVLGLNMLQEYYGRQSARQVINANLFILGYLVLASLIQNLYVPNKFDTTSASFDLILAPILRIGIVSMLVFYLTQYIDYILFWYLKQRFGEKYFVVRNFLSVAFCQFIDTALFTIFGLWGVVHNIVHVAVISYLVKLLTIFAISPFLFAFHKFALKKVSNRNIEKTK